MDCLLCHLLECEKEVTASKELFETYFITIRYLRKETNYGKKYTREQELELFKKKLSLESFLSNMGKNSN